MSVPLRPGRSAAVILATAALLIACSIAFSYITDAGFVLYLLSIPGRWLTASLLWTAWWVPTYLLLLAWIAFDVERTTWTNIIFINAATVPVLTLALLFQLARGNTASPLVAVLSASFTTRASILVVSLVLALEALLLLQLPNLLTSRRRSERVAALPPPDDDSVEGSSVAGEAAAVDGAPDVDNAAVVDNAPVVDEPPIDGSDVAYLAPERTDRPTPREVGDVPDDEEVGSFEDEFESLDPQEDDEIVHIHFKRGDLGLRDTGLGEAPIEADEPGAYDHEPRYVDEPTYTDDHGDYIDDDTDDVDDATDIDDSVDVDDAVAIDNPDQLEGADDFDETNRPEVQPGFSPRPVRDYLIPISGILDDYDNARYWEIDEVTEHSAEQLKGILDQFGIEAEVTGIRKGPVITMFEMLPAPGIKLARITNLADNIAMGLAASSVRIVAPIPGKRAVGIEIPNRRRHTVSLAEMMDTVRAEADDHSIPVALGKDIPGEAQVIDLTRTPHLLIAGATGSGKSVCVNSIICSVLFQRTPLDVKLILIDPKIVELKHYNDIPHLLTPVITDPKRAFQALQWLLYEMERRYAVLDSMSVRDVKSYNAQIRRKRMAAEPLPYIVVVIDEFADLMATSGKELESTVARLAAMSRAVGIHLILATQRPSTDVITGLIKANIPSRIAFAVAQKVDSRIILDSMGADKLLGQGDMLFTSSWDPFPVRLQGAYVSDDEVERLVDEVKRYGEPDYIDDEIFFEEEEEIPLDSDENDPLMEQAIEIVLSARKASASYLQRRLKVGYNRAARMVEEMERIGIVGPQNGSKPREVIGSP